MLPAAAGEGTAPPEPSLPVLKNRERFHFSGFSKYSLYL